ncbi:ATP-dependent helicase HrpB [Azospirillum doebereinerae]|uniref:ATP-dependent helicase HrpB n=2 Tax=Azospirillum doebereinerae TaxID=92933 RepID=A0A3S0V3W2_9PROT|nr:ATP-dependent helicase HrpB [Azospirillum doebereinerae]RUQ66140.1 ATP-dependent helicase HrpB [Azospirillum doebereinerae]
MPPLPIDPVLPELLDALRTRGVAVLQAPPGAGKTTRVPLALLDQDWLAGRKVIVVEPRRLAARAAAHRMAAMLGQEVGGTVGYRVRQDSRVGPKTRIEVMTDGLFLRRIQDSPELPDVGAVLFDEFHERGIDSDLSLALTRETREALREDLRLVAMSATLDGGPVSALLGDASSPAPVVTSEGRAFPVETRHLDAPPPGARIEDAVAATLRRALREEPGNALVFLPGTGEIRRVQSLLEQADLGPGVVLAPLYGDMTTEAQDAAIGPTAPGTRKVVLATSIAETSLTIEGIRIVVDSGMMRVPRFDPRGGMTRLVTVKVSQASADQRRGRAGRLEPGVCYRLWPEAAHRALAPHTAPEILDADLAPLALELAAWGVKDPADLPWLDAPPAAAMAQARELLGELGALESGAPDGAGGITPAGKRMARLGVHPRLARMMLDGAALGLGPLACTVAALLGERDIVRAQPGFRDADLRLRVDLLRGEERGGHGAARGIGVDRNRAKQAVRQAQAWRRQLNLRDDRNGGDSGAVGRLLALAYPDRIGQRRPGGNPGGVAAQYRLSGGRGAYFQEAEPLSAEDWLVVADLDGAARESRIFLAAPVTLAELEDAFADRIRTEDVVVWDGREQAVLARRRRMLFALVLKDERLSKPPADAMTAAMVEGVRAMGLACLPWTNELRAWRTRLAFLRRREGEDWPDLSDEALLAGLEDWLAPFLDGVSRRAHLDRIDLSSALRNQLPWDLKTRMDAEAPTHVEVPSGSRIPIDYDGEEPVLAVRLQEMFGLAETPRIAGGKVPLLLHLLSPARRPMQVTRDLASFWANTYKAVKADLKGQYPKHYWPDNPLEAEPTARAKPRGR